MGATSVETIVGGSSYTWRLFLYSA